MSTGVHNVKETLSPKGLLELFVTKGRPNLILSDKVANPHNLPIYRDCEIDFSGCEIIDTVKQHNIIVNKGKDAVIESLTTGFVKTLARLAVGDNGTFPSDPTSPKIPSPTMTELYNEVGRSDAEAIILNVGTATLHEVRVVKTFSAIDWVDHMTAFFNQSKPVLNEIGLIMVDLSAAPLPRETNFGPYNELNPNIPSEDEVLFAIRTHKSVPFEADNNISVTVRYTIYIE